MISAFFRVHTYSVDSGFRMRLYKLAATADSRCREIAASKRTVFCKDSGVNMISFCSDTVAMCVVVDGGAMLVIFVHNMSKLYSIMTSARCWMLLRCWIGLQSNRGRQW